MTWSIRLRNYVADMFGFVARLLEKASERATEVKWFIWRCSDCGKSMKDTPCAGNVISRGGAGDVRSARSGN